MRFKALRGSPEGEAQRGQYLLVVDLGRYKRSLRYFKTQTRGVSVRTLGLKGGWIWNGPHRLEKGKSVARTPKGGWIWGQSHIDWRKERVPARTLGPEGGWIVVTPLIF